MSHLLALSLACFLVVTVNGLPLKDICAKDHFEYEGQTVNAYLKVERDETIEPLENYLIEIPAGFEEVLDSFRMQARRIVEIKEEFNKLLLDVYREEFLLKVRESADIEKKLKQLSVLKNQTTDAYQTIFILTGGLDLTNEIQENFQSKFVKMGQFLDGLRKLVKQEMITELLLNEEALNQTLDKNEPREGQKAVFGKETLNEFYSQSLYQFDKVHLNKESKLFFNKQVTATIYYSIYLPFVTERPPENVPCTNATTLPLFYRNKETA